MIIKYDIIQFYPILKILYFSQTLPNSCQNFLILMFQPCFFFFF